MPQRTGASPRLSLGCAKWSFLGGPLDGAIIEASENTIEPEMIHIGVLTRRHGKGAWRRCLAGMGRLKSPLAGGTEWAYNGYTNERLEMAKNRSVSITKESRLSIRVDAVRKAVIARAAKRHGETISEFVLESAYQAAAELLVDEEPISLSKKQLAHVFETLDHPPAKSVAAIRKLLSERSILDG
ncbi:MAG TPA: DUF1778 domain-containing protein [Pirellulales bacterium]|nr:DUF1778 domain-containing protein [Pirellulales bacterium]